MTELATPLADLLLQHRLNYLNTLPDRLAQLDALASAFQHRDREALALPALERCAHSLAGSAGTFGFSVMGETARALELAVEEARAGAERAGPIRTGLTTLRRQLQVVIAGQAGSGP